MTHTRELGFAIRQRTDGHPEWEQQIQKMLHITPQELQKLYAGRMFLTGSDLREVALICDVKPRELIQVNQEEYDKNVVRYMTDFQNRENREKILDLIDAYIDVREALEAE